MKKPSPPLQTAMSDQISALLRALLQKKKRLSHFIVAVAGLLLLLNLVEAIAADPVKIGILSYRSKAPTLAQWKPLAAALKKSIPEHNFLIEIYTLPELEIAVASRQIDFVLTNPGHYLLLARRSGLSAPLATLAMNDNGRATTALGGVIFTLANREDINSLSDIKGKSVAISSMDSFTGYQLQATELNLAGVHLPNDSSLISTGMIQDDIVYKVLNGSADVGFVRTGLLEALASEGVLDLNKIKIINRQQLPDFPLLASTTLYPEWPIATLPHIDENLARRVAASLFLLENNAITTQAIGIHGFVVPADYSPVEDILREARLPPFDISPTFTLADLWQNYRNWIIALSALFLVLLVLILDLFKKNRQIRQSEQRFTTLFEDSPEPMLIIANNIFIDCNPAALKILGFANKTAVLNNHPADISPEFQPDGERSRTKAELYNKAATTGSIQRFEWANIKADGSQFIVNLTLAPAMLNQKAVLLCTWHDLTDRKQAEVALQESEFRWKFAIEGSGDGLWDWDIAKGRVFFSKVWKAMIGYSEDEIGDQAQEWENRIHPEDKTDTQAKLQSVLDGNDPIYISEHRIRCKDGSYKWILTRGMVVNRSENGSPLRMIGSHSDISERKQTAEAREEAIRRIQKIASRVPGLVYQYRLYPDGRACFPFASDAIRDIYRVSPEEVREDASQLTAIFHPDDADLIQSSITLSAQQLTPWRLEYRVKFPDGSVNWLFGNALPELEANGSVLWHGFITDITAEKQSEEKLQLAANVFTHAREGIMITDSDGTIIEVNNAFTFITGYSREEVVGGNPRILTSGRQDKEFFISLWQDLIHKGHWYGEIWNRRKNGEVYIEMLTISSVKDSLGVTRQYVALFSDITAIKEHERQLEHIAHYDALTSLPNRVLLADRLRQAMTQTQRRGQRLAVAFLDLDGFKSINDNHGHEAGDQLLMNIASRMKHVLREGDTLARLGGDEFVAVMLDIADADASIPMLSRLLTAASQPVYVGDIFLQVSASLGVTFYPQDEDNDADQLLRQADQAMYQAKLAGKNRYYIFDAEKDRSVRGHHESLGHIRTALSANQFVLFYQPKVNMRTGEIIGAEALIRWQHPERGLISPAVFLPVIENHPLAIDVGEWVIDTALTQMKTWQSAGLHFPISVNVSAFQLQQIDFIDRLRALLAAHPEVKPSNLELEVLETSALEDLSLVSKVIHACRDIGVDFALDDFGTGYSSLTYLKRLPISKLKIDQSFVCDMLHDPDDRAIVEGVLSLAKAFSLQPIAEGVETIKHGEILLELGCELAQGYGIARPMPAIDLPAWAENWRPDPSWRKADH